MQYDVNFSARMHSSSPNVARYTCACIGPDGSTYLPATTANLAAVGGIVHGLFADNSGPNGITSIQVSGTVLGAMAAGLVGAGSTTFVGPNASGVLTIGATPIVGSLDAFGNVTLSNFGTLAGQVGGTPYTAHGPIAQYDAVCSFSPGVLQTATPALLIAGSVLVGVAPIAVPGGSTFTPVTIGQTITVPGLSGGVKGTVGINGLGGIVKVDPGGWEIGTVDASNTLTVSPKTPLIKAPKNAINPVIWGVIPNDWNSCLANDAAWTAMMLNMCGPNDLAQTTEIFFDQPLYFSEPPQIIRQINLKSTGGTSNSKAFICTPTSRNGLIAQNGALSSDGGNATRSQFTYISMTQSVPPLTGARPTSGTVISGHFYTIPGETRYYVLCTVGGTTAGSLPATMTPGNGSYAPLPGLLITSGDNGVQWKFYAYAGAQITVRKSSHAYAIGDITRPFGDSRFAQVATTAGTTAASQPIGYAASSEGVFINDGGVIWRTDIYAAFNNRAALTSYENCFVGGLYCLAFYGRGQGAEGTNCNNIQISTMRAGGDARGTPGGGIYIGGTDANGGKVAGCNMLNLGFGHDGYCGFGYWDHSIGLNTWVANYTEASSGPGIVSDGIGGSSWLSCHSENYLYSRLTTNDIILNCNLKLAAGSYPGALLLNAGDSFYHQGVKGNDYTSAPNVHAAIELGGSGRAVYTFRSDDDLNSFSWSYGSVGVGKNNWSFGLTPSENTTCFSVSGGRALGGSNQLYIRNGGFFAGESTHRWFGADRLYKQDKNTNGYLRNVGDRWPTASVGNPGDFVWDSVVTQGYDAPVWAATVHTAGSVFGPFAVQLADCINDGAGRVFKCTKGGTSTGSAPNWASITVVDSTPARVWLASSRWAMPEIVRPTTGNTHKYSPKTPLNAAASAITPPTAAVPGFTTWLPNTQYYANSIVAMSSGVGDTFFVFYVQPFSLGNTFSIGDLATPTIAKYGTSQMNRVFQCIATTNGSGTIVSRLAGGASGIAGVTEPTWPTDGVSTVESGTCLFQEVAMISNAVEPLWNTHRPGSNPLNGIVTFDGALGTNESAVQHPISWLQLGMYSSTVEPTWAGAGADTVDNPNAKICTDVAFGLTWTAVGTDSTSSRIADSGGVEWTLFGTTPAYAQGEKLVNAGALALSGNGTIALSRSQAFYELIAATTTSLDFGVGGSTGPHQAGSHHRVLNAGATEIAIAPSPAGIPNTIIPAKTLYTFGSDGTALYQENPSQSPVYRPPSRAGLKFWARADLLFTLNSTTVSKVLDLSGNAGTLVQAVAGKQPVWNATGINGRPTLTGLAANSTFLWGPSTDIVTVALTAFCVIKTSVLGLQDQPFGKAYGGIEWLFQGVGASGKIQFAVGGTNNAVSNAAVNDGLPHVLIAVWDKAVAGGLITLYVDGVAQTITSTFAGTISGTDAISLGAQVASGASSSAAYFTGETGEAGIYNVALGGSDLTNLTTYLKTLWGVP